jgi:hypothetical protein
VGHEVVLLVRADEFHELLHSPFLENAHQGRSNGLT